MICPPCAAAADLCTSGAPLFGSMQELATSWHAQCTGCCCQHQVASREVLAARRAAMPRGGLARIVGLLPSSLDSRRIS